MSSRRKTIKAAMSTGAGTLVSRLLGLVRDMTMATMFGVGAAMDGFFLAFLIPNLFRRLFGEGALSGAVIPVVSEYREKKGIADVSRLMSQVSTALGLLLSAITGLGLALVFLLPHEYFGFGDNPAKWEIFSDSLLILSPLAVLLCLNGVWGGLLNAYGRFAVPALLPALQNMVWLAALALVGFLGLGGEAESGQIAVVCWGILAGAVLVTVLQYMTVRRAGIVIRFEAKWNDPGLRSVVLTMAPAVLGLAVFQLNTLIDNLLAEWLVEGDGAVSAYAFASRVFQFPLGVVGIALGTAVFPLLAKYAARGEPSKVAAGLLNGIRLLGFIVLPAAAGLIAVNDELVHVLLRHGEFDSVAASRTARVLLFFSMALPIVAAIQLVGKAFLALRDIRTLNKVALWSVGVNLVANLILVQTPLREAGLALGTAISGAFNLTVLCLILMRRMKGSIVESGRIMGANPVSDRMAQPLTPSGLRRFWKSLGRSALTSLCMCVVVRLFLDAMPSVRATGLRELATIAGAIMIGMAVYFGAHLIMKSEEIWEAMPRRFMKKTK
jgi:putative peptidoglycan lipid II flippase